ncbi:unnamed protein product [Coregonus sp. 'balchen']|nr:unnamed protein product [Coregonus sp. 'balchen']
MPLDPRWKSTNRAARLLSHRRVTSTPPCPGGSLRSCYIFNIERSQHANGKTIPILFCRRTFSCKAHDRHTGVDHGDRNYHVWVEAWMRRPVLSGDSLYDGWQAVDPTPQIDLKLVLKSDHRVTRTPLIHVNAQAIRYTGIPSSQIKTELKQQEHRPNQGRHMLENNSIKVSAVVTDKVNSEEVYITEKDIVPERPSVTIKDRTVQS